MLGCECSLRRPASAEQMAPCLERVAQFVLLQTGGVLDEPWTLLALYRAHLCGVPLCCVLVEGADYDFRAAWQHLSGLESRLAASALEEMRAVLASLTPPADVAMLQSALAPLLPSLISVSFHPDGAESELAATVRDVRDKLESARSAIRRTKERAPRWRRHAPRTIELSQPMISSVEPLSGTA